MYINAEWFTFQKDKIVYTWRLRFHGNQSLTTRPSSHARSRAVFNILGRDEFKAAENTSLLFYEKVK